MLRRAIRALAVVVLLAAPGVTRAQEDYLDVYTVKVKPEKSAEFNVLMKKWVEANRRNNGDRWVTIETMYGEGDVYTFISTRHSYAEIDKPTSRG